MSYYCGKEICLTTKHDKEAVIAPQFKNLLDATIVTADLDTDLFGTFSGEIERYGTALNAAKKKCIVGLEKTGIKYGISSEGSFGPHPSIFFIPADIEILYFIDLERNFHLYESELSTKTNYKSAALENMDSLLSFAQETIFPSHALILRPNISEDKNAIFKSIQDIDSLEKYFNASLSLSEDGKVWVEADMRANMNPSRMSVIGNLSKKLAQRLKKHCPKCKMPGWGIVGSEKGLRCSLCSLPTEVTHCLIYGCVLCDYKYYKNNPNMDRADSTYCNYCNP